MDRRTLCGSLVGTVRGEQWIEYWDENGKGHAEIDCILVRKDVALIFELKRTFTTRGLVQLSQLYIPLVKHILPDRRVFGLLVCKNLRPEANDQYLRYELNGWLREVQEAVLSGRDLPVYTLQWEP